MSVFRTGSEFIEFIMFSYYGSKSKVVDLYPRPKHGKIIEPFAGSARYALRYFDREVLLVDKYPVIVDLWNYLKQASERDILSLPEPEKGEDLRSYSLSDGERYLLGFLANRGNYSPCNLVNNFSDIGRDKRRIARGLYKIRHWEIRLGDYQSIENEVATWFIDPPYTAAGKNYVYGSEALDYSHLAEWSLSRMGQVIVCENLGADWLPFYSLRPLRGINGKNVEAIWSNEKHNFQARQMDLFGDANP